jgi:plastocyanin
VTIQDMAYTPATLTVGVGATVTWVWQDGAIAHDVKGDGFKSKVISEGTLSHRFTEPGTYTNPCTLHLNMTGTIEVTADAAADPQRSRTKAFPTPGLAPGGAAPPGPSPCCCGARWASPSPGSGPSSWPASRPCRRR